MNVNTSSQLGDLRRQRAFPALLAAALLAATVATISAAPPLPQALFQADQCSSVFHPLQVAAGFEAPNEVLSVPLGQGTGAVQLDPSFSAPRLSFERNDGQTDTTVKFLARGVGQTVFLTPTELVLSLHPKGCRATPIGRQNQLRSRSDQPIAKPETTSRALRIRVLGANEAVSVQGQDEQRGRVNYFLGNHPAKWRTNIPTYARVRYQEIYPGIDLVYYGHEGQLEYDFVVAPGANPAVIALALEGADRVQVAPGGDLLVDIAGEEIRCRRPAVYQQIYGERRFIGGKYVLGPVSTGGMTWLVTFEVEQADPSIELVIDPELIYSTYLGGGGANSDKLFAYGDCAYGITVDTQGNAYLTGYTQTINSLGFPTKDPIQMAAGDFDAFVTKLSPAGDLIYSTYLGGAGEDRGMGIAIDLAGSAYVTGWTASSDFPTANALQPTIPARVPLAVGMRS
jgi:hypothetical protein